MRAFEEKPQYLRTSQLGPANVICDKSAISQDKDKIGSASLISLFGALPNLVCLRLQKRQLTMAGQLRRAL